MFAKTRLRFWGSGFFGRLKTASQNNNHQKTIAKKCHLRYLKPHFNQKRRKISSARFEAYFISHVQTTKISSAQQISFAKSLRVVPSGPKKWLRASFVLQMFHKISLQVAPKNDPEHDLSEGSPAEFWKKKRCLRSRRISQALTEKITYLET